MDVIRIDINREGIRRVLKSEEVQRDLDRRAEKIATEARLTAPVSDAEHPHYKDNIIVRRHPTPNRARAEVVANVDHAILVEIRHRTMGKAAEAARDV